jgi:CRP/FNR family cyclic AMP-dependent transcriptional regulator
VEAADVAGISLFADLEEAECARVAELFEEQHLLPYGRPAVQGDFGYRFFVILDGTAVVRVDGDEVAELGPGDFFGEMALLGEEGRRTAEVEARTRIRCASVMGWDFRRLLDDHPGIRAKVEAAIARYRR